MSQSIIPHIMKKGLKLNLYHNDELAGRVCIESNADATEALSNFIEESKQAYRPMYMVLHAEDSTPSLNDSLASNATGPSTSKKNPRKVWCYY